MNPLSDTYIDLTYCGQGVNQRMQQRMLVVRVGIALFDLAHLRITPSAIGEVAE